LFCVQPSFENGVKNIREKILLHKRWKVMTRHLESFLVSGSQEQLHQFRVEIKKIKSLLSILATDKRNEKLFRIFKPVNRIYHHAGIIRDASIYLQLAEKFKLSEPAFDHREKDLMARETVAFLKNGATYLKMVSKTGKKLERELKNISDTDIGHFYEVQLNSVALTFAKREFNEEMHECRKRIKNLLYNKKLAARSFDNDLPLDLPYLKHLEEDLGLWHESILARELFAAECKDQQTLSLLDRQREKLERSIVRISSNFWQKATNTHLQKKN
jgi:CHAD domain-containing protein